MTSINPQRAANPNIQGHALHPPSRHRRYPTAMHELSLAGSILRLVEQAAAREHFARVTTLHLEAGRLAGVEVQSLRFALQAVAPGTCLEGAVVEVDEPPAEGRCADCGASFTVEARAEPCPRCGGFNVMCRGGDTLRVVDLVVAGD